MSGSIFDLKFKACLYLWFVFCILCHQGGHAIAAKLFGKQVGDDSFQVSLNPFKFFDLWGSLIFPILCMFLLHAPPVGWTKPLRLPPGQVRTTWWRKMLIALAGPAMNFLIALPFFLLGSLFLSMLFGALKSLFFQVLVLFGDPRAIMVVPAMLLGALKEHANEVQPVVYRTMFLIGCFTTTLSLMSFNLLPFPRLDSIDLIRSLVPDRYRSLLAKLDGKKMMFLFIPLQLIIVKVFYGLPFLGIVSFGEKILKTLVEAQ